MTAPLDTSYPAPPADLLVQETLATLRECTLEYLAALELRNETTSAACEMLNRLNEAQRKVGALVDNLKETAPLDSDWYRGHRNSDLPYPGPNLAQVQP